MNTLGTMAIGIRAPIIRSGDNLTDIVTESLLKAVEENGLTLNDRDIVAVTEAILARSQNNYASTEQIAKDISNKFGKNATVGLIFPILSRNRFSLLLKAISSGVKRLIVQLSYPSDEVGNGLIDINLLDEAGINPAVSSFTEEEFRRICPNPIHPFTGVDYIKYYRELNANIEIVISNDPLYMLKYTKCLINADIHSRERTKRLLLKAGAEKVYSMSDLMTSGIDGSGFHPEYGLLGSNIASTNKVKLFPRNAQSFVEELQARLVRETGKLIECMVYGDGAFKDPVGGIWELADPVVCPGFTEGLSGTPNELKLKYLADNDAADLSGEAASAEIKRCIAAKEKMEPDAFAAQGTTPRRYTDLLGSLADLTSGSGDKGTPIVLIQNYFKNYSK